MYLKIEHDARQSSKLHSPRHGVLQAPSPYLLHSLRDRIGWTLVLYSTKILSMAKHNGGKLNHIEFLRPEELPVDAAWVIMATQPHCPATTSPPAG